MPSGDPNTQKYGGILAAKRDFLLIAVAAYVSNHNETTRRAVCAAAVEWARAVRGKPANHP